MAAPLLALAAPALIETGLNLLGNVLGNALGNNQTQLPPNALDLVTGNTSTSGQSSGNPFGGVQSPIN